MLIFLHAIKFKLEKITKMYKQFFIIYIYKIFYFYSSGLKIECKVSHKYLILNQKQKHNICIL